MSKKALFEESEDEEVSFKTENEYAKKYDTWREKEELHKLEQKYGSKALNSDASSDSEDESDEPLEVSEEMEKQFLKTLSLLKNKDPRIYNPDFKFFKNEQEAEKKPQANKLSFADSDDDDDDDDGNIFKVEKVAPEVKSVNKENDSSEVEESPTMDSKEDKLKEYLTGKAEKMDDEVEQDLAPLKALWSDPKLNEGEAFLRDYILNKRYLEDGDAGEAEEKIRDDEELDADEKIVEEQGKFERAYNFRFEEPDEEYLKRFPRTMNYIRPKDNRRSRKRAEVRTRKEEEKKKKMEEIARMKALKLKEIQEKIAKIKEVTGNDDLAFKDEDIEGDFDPDEHDKRMKAIFDEQYYGGADDQKPVFPDLDEELEIENWKNYEGEYDEENQVQEEDGPHCEDEDFNMDADYDPKKARLQLLEEIEMNLGKKKRNRKKKSKLAQLLSTEKPKFVPTVADKTYGEYMDEYYKMDCEDVIGGDLPTRFKYREVVPNDYGLTVEEILLADDKELTQWVPLKKIVKYRPNNIEKGEVKIYSQKAADVKLKKKILPSLFKNLSEEPDIVVPVEELSKKKRKKKKNKKKNPEENDNIENADENEQNEVEDTEKNGEADVTNESEVVSKKKRKKHKEVVAEGTNSIEIDVEQTTEVSNEKRRKKKKKDQDGSDTNNIQNSECSQENVDSNIKEYSKKAKKNKNTQNNDVIENNLKHKLDHTEDTNNHVPNKKKKKKKNKPDTNLSTDQTIDSKKASNNFKKPFKQKAKFNNKQNDNSSDNPLGKLSDERLKAYGLNPKKYRGFLKYKKF